MTNDELVKRLRELSPQLSMLDCEDVLQAANRIEALEAESAELVESLEWTTQIAEGWPMNATHAENCAKKARAILTRIKAAQEQPK